MKKDKKIKVCFAASSGGHFEQLMMLRPLMDKYTSFIVTEKTSYHISSDDNIKMYYLKQVNRKEKTFIFSMLYNFFKSIRIFLIEKPDYLITTGVLAIIPMAHLMKLFGKKLIFIESFAKLSSPTLTGKHLYKSADRFYVQWEKMLETYPDAIYKGGIY